MYTNFKKLALINCLLKFIWVGGLSPCILGINIPSLLLITWLAFHGTVFLYAQELSLSPQGVKTGRGRNSEGSLQALSPALFSDGSLVYVF